MPATLVRRIPPTGVPGQPLQLRRRPDGRSAYVGDDSTDLASTNSDSATVQAWTAQVTSQGLVATRFPSGILAGLLCTRLATKDPTLGWNYTLAPLNVLAADSWTSYTSYLTLQAGDVAAALQSASQAVLAAPGNLFQDLTGLPSWVLWAAGGLILTVVVVAMVPKVRTNPGRRNSGRFLWYVR